MTLPSVTVFFSTLDGMALSSACTALSTGLSLRGAGSVACAGSVASI